MRTLIALLLLTAVAHADEADDIAGEINAVTCKTPQLDAKLFMRKKTNATAMAKYTIDKLREDECKSFKELVKLSYNRVALSETFSLLRYWKFRETYLSQTYDRDVNDLAKTIDVSHDATK